jgi:hypothetical protein
MVDSRDTQGTLGGFGTSSGADTSEKHLRRRDLRTLAEARQYVHDNMREGVDCPCCDQKVRIYERKLSSIMARALIAFYRYVRRNGSDAGAWFHALNVLQAEMPSVQGSGDYAKLRHWGLIEAKGEAKEDGNPSNGMYRLTERGVKFALGLVRVPKHVYIFDDHLLDIEREDLSTTNIREALGDGFKWDELMNAVAPEAPKEGTL